MWSFFGIYFSKPYHPLKFIHSEKATKFVKFSPYFWLQYIQSKVRWRFRKIFWPSQNIWTLWDFDKSINSTNKVYWTFLKEGIIFLCVRPRVSTFQYWFLEIIFARTFSFVLGFFCPVYLLSWRVSKKFYRIRTTRNSFALKAPVY